MTITPHSRLTPTELETFGRELDAIRTRVVADLGERDATYLKRVVALQRRAAIGGRALLFAGWLPPAWLAGTSLLALSKILENMEIGHNVMHGQYDFMRDPAFEGKTYEWDAACPGDDWRHSHNYLHHTFTNVVGKDRDVGYSLLRMSDDQPWSPHHRLQLLYALALAVNFQWGIALYDLELERLGKGKLRPGMRAAVGRVLKKGGRQLAKDYLLFPALAGPAAVPVALGNLTANLVRNLWSWTVIFCGHFPEEVEMFDQSTLATETRGGWYLRQLLGSANLEGSKLMHLMTGNLSHQIEHHLFPDLPAHRYAEIAVEVRAICARHGLPYHTGPMPAQITSVFRRIARLARKPKPKPAPAAAAIRPATSSVEASPRDYIPAPPGVANVEPSTTPSAQ